MKEYGNENIEYDVIQQKLDVPEKGWYQPIFTNRITSSDMQMTTYIQNKQKYITHNKY